MAGNMAENGFYVKLKNRGAIRLEGADRHEFLQGLITNDIRRLSAETPLYACLLTPQGKFLYDFFIYEGDGYIMLDCEGGERAEGLYKKLNMYRLRKDVQIALEPEVAVFAVFGVDIGPPDPRHPDIGNRTFEMPALPELPFKEWDARRIRLGIPDGSRDLIPEKSTMDEANMDTLNAVDYKKGCYVGQELTARMHYRGLGKRKLQPVRLDTLPEGAEIRSQCGDIAIALVKTKPAN